MKQAVEAPAPPNQTPQTGKHVSCTGDVNVGNNDGNLQTAIDIHQAKGSQSKFESISEMWDMVKGTSDKNPADIQPLQNRKVLM